MRLQEILKDPLLLDAVCLWDENRRTSNPSPETLKSISMHENSKAFMEAVKELSALDWIESPDLTAVDEEDQAVINMSTGFSIQSGPSPIQGYTLLFLIGKGSFGEVWKAVGPGGYELAMKIIPMQDGFDLVEIRALELFKTIRHPHLISIFGFWLAKGYLWIAMELADCNLLEFLKDSCTLSKIHELFAEAAEAIDYLNHGINTIPSTAKVSILHRDIKPQNMLILGGKLKLGDFGLARILDPHKNEHSGCLTTAYSPPEFFNGKMSITSDQYSLAISYCKIKGGRVPFIGTSAEVMAGHCNGKPDLSMLFTRERTVVGRALSKNPEKRWENCREFINQIQNPGLLILRQFVLIYKSAFILAFASFLVILVSLYSVNHFYNSSVKKDMLISRYRQTILHGHTMGEVTCFDLSENSKIACTGGEDRQVVVWDIENKKPLQFLKGHNARVAGIAVSSDGYQCLSGGAYPESSIFLWDLRKGSKTIEFKGHQHSIRAVKFLPGNIRAVSASMDGTARLWDLKGGRQIRFFEQLDTIDQNNLTSGSEKQIWAMNISKDGMKMVSCTRGGKIYVHETETGKLLGIWSGPKQYFRGFTMNEGGTTAYTSFGGSSSTLRDAELSIIKWNLNNGEKESLLKADSIVECLVITPDNMNLFGFQRNGPGFVWNEDTKSFKYCFEQLAGNVRCAKAISNSFSTTLFLGCKDSTFRIIDFSAKEDIFSN